VFLDDRSHGPQAGQAIVVISRRQGMNVGQPLRAVLPGKGEHGLAHQAETAGGALFHIIQHLLSRTLALDVALAGRHGSGHHFVFQRQLPDLDRGSEHLASAHIFPPKAAA
jgi:hypothetical protein